jgi:hypothetical protein
MTGWFYVATLLLSIGERFYYLKLNLLHNHLEIGHVANVTKNNNTMQAKIYCMTEYLCSAKALKLKVTLLCFSL